MTVGVGEPVEGNIKINYIDTISKFPTLESIDNYCLAFLHGCMDGGCSFSLGSYK